MAAFRKRILGFAGVFIILAIIFYLVNEYQKAPADLTSKEPVEKINANALTTLYETNEQEANDKYLGKIIQVSGNIFAINTAGDSSVNVVLGTENEMHKVSCQLAVSEIEKIKNFKPGQPITIKGFCTGYLIDVEMNRCVIMK